MVLPLPELHEGHSSPQRRLPNASGGLRGAPTGPVSTYRLCTASLVSADSRGTPSRLSLENETLQLRHDERKEESENRLKADSVSHATTIGAAGVHLKRFFVTV